jgi:hypothetical protein
MGGGGKSMAIFNNAGVLREIPIGCHCSLLSAPAGGLCNLMNDL